MSLPVIFLSAWVFLCGLVLILGLCWKSSSSQQPVNHNALSDQLLKKNEETLNALVGKINYSLEKMGQIESDLRAVRSEGAVLRDQNTKDGLKLSSELTGLKATLAKIEEKAAMVPPPVPPPPKAEPVLKPIFPHAHVSVAPTAPPVTPEPVPAPPVTEPHKP